MILEMAVINIKIEKENKRKNNACIKLIKNG